MITLAVAVVLVPLLLWPAVGSIVWLATPWQSVDVVAYDLTVFDDTYREHRAFGFALESAKAPFAVTDYVGSSPGGAPADPWPAERPDLVALIDAYGVYTNDDGALDPQGSHRVSGRFAADDARTVIRWAADGTFVYGEASLLAEPTDPEAIDLLSGLFGVEPTGWVGRWFSHLERVPESLRRGDWRYRGPGLVLLNGDDQVVLSGAEAPMGRGTLPDGGSFVAPVQSWFEVVAAVPTPDADLTLTDDPAAVRTLSAAGIPAVIPLIVRTDRTVFVAADASDQPVAFLFRKVAGGAAFMRAMPHASGTAFYYHVYVPLIGSLIDQAATTSADRMQTR